MRTLFDLLTIYDTGYELKRYGNPGDNGEKGDGGYVIPYAILAKVKNMITCGVGYDMSFEEDVLAEFPNIKSIAYDGSVEGLPNEDAPITFVKKIIGEQEDQVSLNTLVSEPHTFLKIDIEGNEFDVFDAFDKECLKNIDMLVVEFHMGNEFSGYGYYELGKILEKIEDELVLVHLHGNNFIESDIYCNCGVYIPRVMEMTFINKKYVDYIKKSSATYPLKGLDVHCSYFGYNEELGWM